MASRAWLETWKYLDAKELLTVVTLVCTDWKKSVYSDEILLHFLEGKDQTEEEKSLPLYRRLKKCLKTVKYLLHSADGKLHIWNIHCPTEYPAHLKHIAFLNSSRYAMISQSKAMVTGGVRQETSCLQVDIKTGIITPLSPLLRAHAWHGITVLRHVVYISGGDLARVYKQYAEKYEKGRWTEIADMTIPRYNHTLCAHRHLVYAFGGCNNQGCQDSIECYNGHVWSLATMKLPRPQNYSSVPFGPLIITAASISGKKQLNNGIQFVRSDRTTL
jgi:hypothetical protein